MMQSLAKTKPALVLASLTAFLLLQGGTARALREAGEKETERQEREWLGDVDEARALAEKTGRYILVDLFAEWCTWCKVLEKEVFTSDRFQRWAEDYVLLRVDTEDGAEGTELQERYGAFALPTLLILDADGVQVGQVQGYAPTERYLQNLQLEVSLHRMLLARYEEVVQGDDPEAIEKLADELHSRQDGARAAALYARLLDVGSLDADETAWTRYYHADSLRLTGDFEGALESLDRARELAAREEDGELLELADFLDYQIARDRGDCAASRQALERFVEEHPRSPFLGRAKEALTDLREAEGSRCAS